MIGIWRMSGMKRTISFTTNRTNILSEYEGIVSTRYEFRKHLYHVITQHIIKKDFSRINSELEYIVEYFNANYVVVEKFGIPE